MSGSHTVDESFFKGMEPQRQGAASINPDNFKPLKKSEIREGNPLFGQTFKKHMVGAIANHTEDAEKIYKEIEHETVTYIANIIKDLAVKAVTKFQNQSRSKG